MSDRETAQNVIDAYRKRQQKARKAPVIVIAVVLIVLGLAFLLFWLLSSGGPSIALFPSETPTATNTATATATATQTSTPTVTATATLTPTATIAPTQSGPFVYQVEEGDTLWSISNKFQVDLVLLLTVNNLLDPANQNIRTGDKIIIPGADTELPTATPLPEGIGKGTLIDYQVQLGDSLLSIALKFNSTVEAIKEENKIENENQLFAGQMIKVPVNMVTPAPTFTITPTVVLQIGGTVVPTAITPAGPAATNTPAP